MAVAIVVRSARVARRLAPPRCRKVRGLCAVIVALSYAAVAPAAADDEPPPLRGTWVVTSATRNGEPAEDIVGHRLTLGEKTFEIHKKDGALDYQGTFALQPEKTPPAIDFHLAGDAAKGTVWRGIYERKGRRLTICDNSPDTKRPRPTKLAAPRGSGYVLVVLERAKE